MKKILDRDAPVLRKKASSVEKKEIPSAKIRAVIDDMRQALASQKDGVAIAAPQIGESVRIIVVSKKIFGKFAKESALEKEKVAKDMVLINPVIIKQSKKKEWMEEGCLSVRWLYGKTHRSQKTTVRGVDEHGHPFTYGGSGLLSQIFQHEIDHLNGVLFIDHAKDIGELKPEEISKEEL